MVFIAYKAGIIRSPIWDDLAYITLDNSTVVQFSRVDVEKCLSRDIKTFDLKIKFYSSVYGNFKTPIYQTIGSGYLHKNGKKIMFQIHLDLYFAYYHAFMKFLHGINKTVPVFEFKINGV